MSVNFERLRTLGPARAQERKYDIHTAVTFLIAGLGIGSILALLLAPRSKSLGSFVRDPASVRPSPAL
jgi:hypothetical protein